MSVLTLPMLIQHALARRRGRGRRTGWTPFLHHVYSPSSSPSPSPLLSLPPSSPAPMDFNLRCNSSLADFLWEKSKPLSMAALYHPFVVSLAAGKLQLNAFRHYIAQDAFFLQAFSDAYRLARENVDHDALKLSISDLQHAVDNELMLHSSYAKNWGVDLAKENKPDAATTKYTEFLLTTASGKGALKEYEKRKTGTAANKNKIASFTIAAMTPCMKLYSFLGQEISTTFNEGYHGSVYCDWIATYSSKSFQASTQVIEQLLDCLANYLDKEDFEYVERLYLQALKLELDFFSAQPNCDCPLLPFIKSQTSDSRSSYLLMSDFDLTCTMTDSCTVLADATIRNASKHGEKHHTSIKQTWEFLKKSYGTQYNNIIHLLEDAGNPQTNYDDIGLRAFLEKLSQFEVDSNSELIRKSALQGLELEEVRRIGGEIPLHEGCSDFFKEVCKYSNVMVHIISVCWSKALIEGALSKRSMDFIKVHSNELSLSGSSTSGDIIRVLETPFDKERTLQEILKHVDLSGPTITIYIGDSVTDLLCLLECDIGIVIGSSSSLKKVARSFGISMIPLYKETVQQIKSAHSEGWQKSKGVIYTVSNWHEISAFMIGSSPPNGT